MTVYIGKFGGIFRIINGKKQYINKFGKEILSCEKFLDEVLNKLQNKNINK